MSPRGSKDTFLVQSQIVKASNGDLVSVWTELRPSDWPRRHCQKPSGPREHQWQARGRREEAGLRFGDDLKQPCMFPAGRKAYGLASDGVRMHAASCDRR